MKVENNTNFIVSVFKDSLSIIDILTLTTFHKQEFPFVTALCCSSEYVFIGTSTSMIKAINFYTLEEIEVCKLKSPCSALFYSDEFLYCGTEEGVIKVYSVRDTGKMDKNIPSTLLSSFSNLNEDIGADEGFNSDLFKYMKSMKHPAPIRQICTDGVEMFVSDMRNKVTIYPSGKVYDMKNPMFKYKNYIFAKERSMLYCKTKEAFAVYLDFKIEVKEYKFNKNGGVLFAQSDKKIKVVEFNNKEVIKEIDAKGCFVYDDDRDRFIIINNDNIETVEGVLKRNYDEMDRIKFKENKITERKKMAYEDDEENNLNVSKFVGIGKNVGYKEEKNKKYFGKNYNQENSDVKLEKLFEDEFEEKKRKYENKENISRNIIESSDENDYKTITHFKQFNSSSLETEEADLLCYNLEGYILLHKNDNFNKIEVVYHNNNNIRKEIREVENCNKGSFYGSNIVLGNKSKIFFFSDENKWEKEIKSEIVGITEDLIFVVDKDLKVFNYEGNEIFNCYVGEIHTMCCYKKKVALFANDLIEIEIFKNTIRTPLPESVDFCCYDEKGRLFFKINNAFYHLYKSLAVKIAEMKLHPLVVFKNNVISLNSTKKLLPSPVTAYTELLNNSLANFVLDEIEEENNIITTKKYNPFAM